MEGEIINRIFQIFSADNREPKTELQYTNNFTLLIAVILSAQSTDIAVNKVSHNLFAKYNDPETMLALGENNIKNYIKTIGLYNMKARNIIKLCKILIDKHHGHVPDNFEQLIELPGVGRKTANVMMNCAFGKPAIAVDTHVFRVSKRLGLAYSNNVDKLSIELETIIPEKWKQSAHNWLVLHGRYICKARQPNCNQCIIAQYCDYYQNQ
jgi:endonuclease-3